MKPLSVVFICLFFSGCFCGCHRTESKPRGPFDTCGPPIPLIVAAYDNKGGPQVQALLANGADVNTADGCGRTALTVAAQCNNVQAVDLLLKHGAQVEGSRNNPNSPLIMAASLGNVESAELLIDHGADIEAKRSNSTPLIAAINNGILTLPNHSIGLAGGRPTELLDMERLLISHGADVNAERDGRTALMIARRRNFVQTVALLKKAGARH
jgi:ankyrin repeat protein